VIYDRLLSDQVEVISGHARKTWRPGKRSSLDRRAPGFFRIKPDDGSAVFRDHEDNAGQGRPHRE
jgi:hypothetical protein